MNRELLASAGPAPSVLSSRTSSSARRGRFSILKSKSLRPLCRIEATEEAVTVTFDLPYVEKKDISLTSTESTLSVEAKMRKAVAVRVGGSVQRHVQFERYTGVVRLPTAVKPEKAKATFKNGLLRVKLPVAKRGNRVRIR